MATKKVIVVFKEDTPPEKIEEARNQFTASGGKVTQVYESALLGFAGEVPEVSAHALSALEAHPNLDYIEPDGEVRIC
ncbi:hypothetical protein BGX31_010544 [Mortierella sp. GBA43]|nr:hypothetical protein BGX31_010544 [Mortierella sp. GBA43]